MRCLACRRQSECVSHDGDNYFQFVGSILYSHWLHVYPFRKLIQQASLVHKLQHPRTALDVARDGPGSSRIAAVPHRVALQQFGHSLLTGRTYPHPQRLKLFSGHPCIPLSVLCGVGDGGRGHRLHRSNCIGRKCHQLASHLMDFKLLVGRCVVHKGLSLNFQHCLQPDLPSDNFQSTSSCVPYVDRHIDFLVQRFKARRTAIIGMATKKPPIEVDTARSAGQPPKLTIASAQSTAPSASAAKSRRSIDLKPALMFMILSDQTLEPPWRVTPGVQTASTTAIPGFVRANSLPAA